MTVIVSSLFSYFFTFFLIYQYGFTIPVVPDHRFSYDQARQGLLSGIWGAELLLCWGALY